MFVRIALGVGFAALAVASLLLWWGASRKSVDDAARADTPKASVAPTGEPSAPRGGPVLASRGNRQEGNAKQAANSAQPLVPVEPPPELAGFRKLTVKRQLEVLRALEEDAPSPRAVHY